MHNVACLPQARTVKPEKELLLSNGSEIAFVSRQRLSKHVPASKYTLTTIEVLLETMFSARPMQRGYKEDNWGDQVRSAVPCESGSNTSTVALRIAGGDEKRAKYLGV
jgi:hypothetical protein